MNTFRPARACTCAQAAPGDRAGARVSRLTSATALLAVLGLIATVSWSAPAAEATRSGPANPAAPAILRTPTSDADLEYWLQNMVWHHRFTTDEVQLATGLDRATITASLKRFGITPENRPKRAPTDPLRVLPYPGGRHPRIGFLDGAVHPQRETKISVFTPWDDTSYVVVDVPEAIWSNLGLTYLAHTHIPTVFDQQGLRLEPREWTRLANGSLESSRSLPNGIAFGARIQPGRDGVRMELWLTNGTSRTLTDLRVQNCVMLKGAEGFNAQTNANKLISAPFVACRSAQGDRWIITAWDPCHRPWANPPVPCLHSDPKFPDCPPGQSRTIRGWLSFYEGTRIDDELARLSGVLGLNGSRPAPTSGSPQ